MNYSELLAKVPEQWQSDFVHFISSGDASPEFLALIDSDERLQAIVEMALTAQISTLDRVLKCRHNSTLASLVPK